ncbi:FUSC family protein [Nocardioides houyundeii]|uniref:FUSC family protein n=1 Tax=Nocardioides houyundeii TaxID=2045452 RepID=UPI001F080EB1|nr:FUSC family protein [Nocardioides houyundeii]
MPLSPGLLSQALRVGPHAGSHRVALRASISVLVPLLLLWAVGRQEWSIYAAFGAFTSLYGRSHVHLSRLTMQATLAVLLTAAVVLGVAVGLSEHREWLAVPVAALVASGASLVSDAQDWHPPGPLFLVFAFAACASVPSEPSDLLTAALVAGGASAFAVAVGGIGSLWRTTRRPDSAERTAFLRPSYAAVAPRHVLLNGAGCLVAGSLATAAGIGHPYWAMVSAVVPLASRDPRTQAVRGLHRVVGTLAGLLLAAALLGLDLSGLALIAVVVVLQAAAELWVGRNYAIALVAVTPLALLMVHLVAPVPAGTLLLDRGVETVIGVAVGLALGWLARAADRRPILGK